MDLKYGEAVSSIPVQIATNTHNVAIKIHPIYFRRRILTHLFCLRGMTCRVKPVYKRKEAVNQTASLSLSNKITRKP